MSDIINIYTFRLIPFDLGCEIKNKHQDQIVSKIHSCPGWDLTESIYNTNYDFLKIYSDFDDEHKISISLFYDGSGIISLRESILSYNNLNELDQYELIKRRKKCHTEILTHSHVISEHINSIIDVLRNTFTEELRLTANKSWENNGLSYVMSFYCINGKPEHVESTTFQDKILALLFPNDYDKKIQYDIKTLDTKDEIITKKFRESYINSIKTDCESLPYIFTFASWSNFIIYGNISDENINNYWEIQKDLQHIWFYTYITDKYIEYSLSTLDVKTPEKHLEKLYNILTEMLFKINKYEGIVNSTLHEKDFRLYEILKKTSRLDLLISSVGEKASLLKDRYSWIIDEKRIYSDKKVELILFIIAILSLISSYDALSKIATIELIILLVGIIILTLILFRSYIFKS